jgi:hypothetical protein
LHPTALEAVRVTVKTPAASYVCAGCRAVELPPSPKSQAHAVGQPADWSVKLTVRGARPQVGWAEKWACGAVGLATTTQLGRVSMSASRALLVIRLTV